MKILAFIFVRLLISLILIAVVAFFVLGGFQNIGKSEPPDRTIAPYGIQTATRAYYAEDYYLDNGVPTIEHYWSFTGKRFKEDKGTKQFPPELYGTIEIFRR